MEGCPKFLFINDIMHQLYQEIKGMEVFEKMYGSVG